MEYWRNWWDGIKKDWSSTGTGVSIKGNNSQVPVIYPGSSWEHMFGGSVRVGNKGRSLRVTEENISGRMVRLIFPVGVWDCSFGDTRKLVDNRLRLMFIFDSQRFIGEQSVPGAERVALPGRIDYLL